MTKLWLSVLIGWLLIIPPVALADEAVLEPEKLAKVAAQISEYLPAAGLTPDKPFYFTKRLKEEVVGLLKRTAQEKYDYQKELASRRLAEAYVMAQKNKYVLADRLFTEFEIKIEDLKSLAFHETSSALQRDNWLYYIEKELYKYQAVLDEMDAENIADSQRKKEAQTVKAKRETSVVQGLKSLLSPAVSNDHYESSVIIPVP